jgi:hypothetical protein
VQKPTTPSDAGSAAQPQSFQSPVTASASANGDADANASVSRSPQQ